ncbi:MAG: hypothetical protein HYV60_20805 [Planctomycetia bacterium]|nr:hypothetical protein [Planctomycetia bacterium]
MPQSLLQTVEATCRLCALADIGGASQAPFMGIRDFFGKLTDTKGFPPRWECGSAWTPGHGWLHILADFAIFGAYAAIPIVLAYFILRRKDIPFPPVMWLFVAFIALCGLGHLIEGTLFWWPWYRLSGVIKATTAIVSWVTVIALLRIVPLALGLPGLAMLNEKLRKEVRERENAELALRERANELEQMNEELESVGRIVFGREDRIIELKREVNDLLMRLAEPTRYPLRTDESI